MKLLTVGQPADGRKIIVLTKPIDVPGPNAEVGNSRHSMRERAKTRVEGVIEDLVFDSIHRRSRSMEGGVGELRIRGGSGSNVT